ncbi:YciI family protein [Alicyclobacillus ferrooxydans]|uniref:YciI family protein n=1 Tax=Alicyclobacillus ferrooxydans TaxID=471514 RepID=UPI003CCB994B
MRGCFQVVTDGLFTEVHELIAGYGFIDVKSREEAIDWAMRAPELLYSGSTVKRIQRV